MLKLVLLFALVACALALPTYNRYGFGGGFDPYYGNVGGMGFYGNGWNSYDPYHGGGGFGGRIGGYRRLRY